MKKVVLLPLLLLVGLVTLMAQTAPVLNISKPEEHLKFKGIEITGTLENMINKLGNHGYTFVSKIENGAIFKGTFANNDCEIIVSSTPKTNIVYGIYVLFEEKNSWYSLKSKYKELKGQLREKYDVRPNVTERFIDPYYEGDGYELQAIRLNKCLYRSVFELNDGDIMLVILEDKLALVYSDKEGESINEREKNQNTYDDL